MPIYAAIHVTLISTSQLSTYSHLQARPGILKPPSSQISPSQPGVARSFTQALGSHLIPYSSPSTQHSLPAPFKDPEGEHRPVNGMGQDWAWVVNPDPKLNGPT
ncbi:hypothetical protein AAC387_Pa07g2876 [Persea americana]